MPVERTSQAVKVGIVLPQTELLEGSVREVDDFVSSAYELGYDHLVVYDHVLSVEAGSRPSWEGYTNDQPFREPLMLSAHVSAQFDMEMVPGVLVLPQRQTALVAKQVSDLYTYTKGRLRLGVGTGWNSEEFRALGMQFDNRGHRLEEQVRLLRSLWSSESVTLISESHDIERMGLNPRPDAAVPVWFGGSRVRRIGRIADGWLVRPRDVVAPDLGELWRRIRESAAASGRDPSAIGLDGIVEPRGDEVSLVAQVDRLLGLGATHITISTLNAGLRSVGEHVSAAAAAARALSVNSSLGAVWRAR